MTDYRYALFKDSMIVEILLKFTLKMQMLLEPVEKKQSKSLNNALFSVQFCSSLWTYSSKLLADKFSLEI